MKKMLIGIVVGIISGLFASGGGLLLVPIYTHVLKLDEKEAREVVNIWYIYYNADNFYNYGVS